MSCFLCNIVDHDEWTVDEGAVQEGSYANMVRRTQK